MQDKAINKTSQLFQKTVNEHISSFTDLYSLSGIYGIINEKSNSLINHNILDFGRASVLTLDGSKVLTVNNDYLTKRIKLISEPTTLTATVQISSNNHNIQFNVDQFDIYTSLSRLDNDLYIFKDKDIKYYYTNICDIDKSKFSLQTAQKLTGQYQIQYQLLLSVQFPSTAILNEGNFGQIISEISTKTVFNGYFIQKTNNQRFYFNHIIQPVTGTTFYDQCTKLLQKIPASGNLINMTQAGLQDFPASGHLPVNGTFSYIDHVNEVHTLDGTGLAYLTGNMLSSSVTGLMIGPQIISSTITSQVFGEKPQGPNIKILSQFIRTNTTTNRQVITGNVSGAAIGLDGSINGGLLQNFTVTSGSKIFKGDNNGKLTANIEAIFSGNTDLITSNIATTTYNTKISGWQIEQVITSYVNYINGLMQVSAATNVQDNVVLNGIVQLSTYNLKLSIDYLMNSIDNPYIFQENTKNIFGNQNDVHLSYYPNFDNKYLTTETIINTQLTNLVSDNSKYIPAMSGNTIVNTRSGISNFPNIENKKTGTLQQLVPTQLFQKQITDKSLLTQLSGISQSYVGLSQTLINNGQYSTWSSKINKYYDFISYISNIYLNYDNQIAKNSRDIYFIFSNILQVTSKSSSGNTKNIESISNFISKCLSIIFRQLNMLPKNFYNRNIHILFNLSKTDEIDLTDETNKIQVSLKNTLQLDNLYNCNIYIQNINNKIPIKFICEQHTIFKFINLDNLYIKNIQFQSCYNTLEEYSNENSAFYPELLSDDTKFKKYMQLIYAINVKFFDCTSCSFDNIQPRVTKYVNNLNIQQALLAYPTYALIFLNNTKLHLNNCVLKNSNQGIIAYCNSQVQYSGNTELMFNSMQWYKQKYKQNDKWKDKFISGTFTRLIDELPILKSDYQKLSSKIINYNDDGLYLTFLPIINYVAGNSICNMIADSDKNIIFECINDNTIKQLPSSLTDYTLSGSNFTPGVTQIGSLFNHTHKNLIDDGTGKTISALTSILDLLTTIPDDPTIGMTNLQLPLNLFQTNDASKAIGYAYNSLNLNNNDVYTYNIFTQYVPIDIYTKISMFYHKEQEQPFILTSYTPRDVMCLQNASGAIQAKKYSTDYFDGYNNGQFWYYTIIDKNIIPNILNPHDYFNIDISASIKDIALDIGVKGKTSGIFLPSSKTIDFTKNGYVYNNPKITNKTVNKKIQKIDSAYINAINKFNITETIKYGQLSGTFFTDENISNISYVRLIKNYFSNDNDLKYWDAPNIGLLTRLKSYSPFKQDLEQYQINISDRYNFKIRQNYSKTAAVRIKQTKEGGTKYVIAFRNSGKGKAIPAKNQICSGCAVFSFTRNTGVKNLTDTDYTNITNDNYTDTPVLANNYPTYTIIPKVNSKYDLNLPFPQNTINTNQIKSQPLNYESVVPPFKFYKSPGSITGDMYNTIINNGGKTETYSSDISELNGVKYMDFSNYYGNGENFVYYTKINNAVIIPSFTDAAEGNTQFGALTGSISLVNEYQNISGQYKTTLADINKFKQEN